MPFSRVIGSDEYLGYLVGAMLWPIETLPVTFRSEGPSRELMLCRKRGTVVVGH